MADEGELVEPEHDSVGEAEPAGVEAPRATWTQADQAANARLMAQLARMSPDRRAQRLRRDKVPEDEVRLAHRELVADLVWRARGIAVDSWTCPGCDAPYTSEPPPIDVPKLSKRRRPPPTPRASYPFEACRCGRPFPSRCVSRGCARVVEPRMVVTASDKLYDVPNRAGPLWELPADRQCEACASDGPYRARLRAWSGSTVPQDVRSIASGSYWGLPEREAMLGAITRWLDNDLGRGLGPCALYFWGEPGRGKTLGAGHAVYQALVERGLAASVVWVTQSQLREWHDQSWQRGSDRARVIAEQATDAWVRARSAPLLVIDELFSAPCRGAFGERMADLVRDRLEERLPSLFTSNHPPEWSARIETDGRIDSRWQSHGVTIELLGRDWRAG